MQHQWVRRGIRISAVAGFAVVALLTLVPASGGAGPAPAGAARYLLPDHPRPGPNQQTITKGFTVLGHSDLGADVDFGDLWAYGTTAYVGTRCGPQNQGGAGVRVVDYADPTKPTVIATLPNPMYTRAEDLVVRAVTT